MNCPSCGRELSTTEPHVCFEPKIRKSTVEVIEIKHNRQGGSDVRFTYNGCTPNGLPGEFPTLLEYTFDELRYDLRIGDKFTLELLLVPRTP